MSARGIGRSLEGSGTLACIVGVVACYWSVPTGACLLVGGFFVVLVGRFF